MSYTTIRYWSCLAFSIILMGSLQAQSIPGEEAIMLDANMQRQVITAARQDQMITLQKLKTGETYLFVMPPDLTFGACLPDISLEGSGAELIQYEAEKHLLRFKATASVVHLKLHYPCEWEASNPPRQYVSLACQTCKVVKVKNDQADMSVLEVQYAGAEELIKDIFIGGECFDVSNLTFSGDPEQIGTFSNGLSNIGYASGIMMGTGDISLSPGPNDLNGSSSSSTGSATDIDLDSIATGDLFDLAAIEFDFTPTQTPLTFSFAFASEEYCEFVNTQFNDAFGFFISGPGITGTQNLAVLPSTNIPISVNTVNHIVNSGFYTPNTPANLDNCQNGGVPGNLPPQPVATGVATQELQFDGFTKKMTAVANVIPCSTYHIKLAIADVGDLQRDAAVFLKAGSFDAGGNASLQWIVNGDPNIHEVVEGCGTAQVLVNRLSADLALPVPVSFTISGTAISGADYSGIPFTVVIPILTTHYIDEAEEMADRIGVINKGELILVEEKEALMRKLGRKQLTLQLATPLAQLPPSLASDGLTLSADGTELTYTYDPQGDRVGIVTLMQDLGALGIAFKDLHTTQSSLEDIFVGLLKEGAAA